MVSVREAGREGVVVEMGDFIRIYEFDSFV